MATTIPNLFNSIEAADYVGVTDSLIRRWCREGRIKARRFGSNWAIDKAELDRFKAKERKPGNPNFTREK